MKFFRGQRRQKVKERPHQVHPRRGMGHQAQDPFMRAQMITSPLFLINQKITRI